MFNVGGGELLVIALIALIVLGPQRLPGAARQAGRTLGELRRLSSGFQDELRGALSDAELDSALAPGPRRDVLARPTPDSPAVTAAVDSVSAPPGRRRAPLQAGGAPSAASTPAAKRATAPRKATSQSTASPRRATATGTPKAGARSKGAPAPKTASLPKGAQPRGKGA